MHKNNIPQSTNKSNKSYQHARLFDFDLLQIQSNEAPNIHQNILLDGVSCQDYISRSKGDDSENRNGKNNISQKTFENILEKSQVLSNPNQRA